MKKIPLTKGYYATVDDDDYEMLAKYKWTAMITGKHIKRVYAYRRYGPRRNRGTTLMHRLITKAPNGTDVDHINHDTVDNRKENLRLCTRSQNLANGRQAVGATGFRGVTYSMSRKTYVAQITGKFLGHFSTPKEAAEAYDAAAIEQFGEFAKPNFPANV